MKAPGTLQDGWQLGTLVQVLVRGGTRGEYWGTPDCGVPGARSSRKPTARVPRYVHRTFPTCVGKSRSESSGLEKLLMEPN